LNPAINLKRLNSTQSHQTRYNLSIEEMTQTSPAVAPNDLASEILCNIFTERRRPGLERQEKGPR